MKGELEYDIKWTASSMYAASADSVKPIPTDMDYFAGIKVRGYPTDDCDSR